MKHNPDSPEFSTAEVAGAAGLPVETLRTWIKRGDIALVHDTPDRFTPGTGGRRLFTFRRSLNICLAAELVRNSISVKEASKIALEFTDMGGNAGGYREGELVDELKNVRLPGDLFPDDTTILVVRFPSDGGEPDAKVERLKDAKDALFHIAGKNCRSVLLIDIDDIYARATAKLQHYRN
ncbi:MerR HTH family regulatory protein [Rhodoblastus acidophilus]|uniref:MerR HTH family regulatory protein n=1 Tax=Rhodoblastus acidophilus TaxID=1074 RepID=A0A212R0N2_RHOAC|nr:MerR family transcriptional regulator [Rhodoblastus acidophilus]SNB65455.1 MerR HTH family regulatory protein [Rhodoblastus acidophilus]